jgi:hypothetical protein
MVGYTKLFGSIIYSTIWREPDAVRLVWITMLAMAGRDGVVEASVPGLADAARVKLADCEKALKCLKSPDPYSRSQEHQGRRIEVVDGGWRILNHGKYRAKLGAENKREANRVRQERHRKKQRGGPSGREQRYVQAQGNGEIEEADRIAAEGLPDERGVPME